MKLGYGLAVDEGYCLVLRPDDSEPSLAESISNLTVGNKQFKFDNDSFPVDAIARMSPESARFMQTCDDVRTDARDGSNGSTEDLLTSIDANHDMMITKEEFTSALGLDNSGDAFDFIQSVFASPFSESSDEDELPPYIPLGQFLHINWGWREYLKTGKRQLTISSLL